MGRKCIVCRDRDAEVPDRERMGRPIKRVCKICHGLRLAEDVRKLLEVKNGKRDF